MQQMLHFEADNDLPTDEELQECIDIANAQNAIVVLHFRHKGLYVMDIMPGMTLEDRKEHLDEIVTKGWW